MSETDRDQIKRDAETYAQRFHEAYERLAPQIGYETRKESAVSWDEVPEQNRALMVAVVSEVLGALLTELEQAEKRAADTERAGIALLDHANNLEHRLAKTHALVEAAKQLADHVTAEPLQNSPTALALTRFREALAAWEAD